MIRDRDTLSILQDIEAGNLDVDQAIRAIEAESLGDAPTPQAAQPTPTAWYVLLGSAIALIAGGGFLGSLGGWWWLVAAPLLLVGGLLLMVALASTRSPWLKLHVRSAETRWPIHVVLPLPLGLTARLIQMVSPFVPDARWRGLDEVLLAMDEELPPGHALVVDVSEGLGDDRVDIHWE